MQDGNNITNEFLYQFLMKMNANMATKEDLTRMATKDDLNKLEVRISEKIDDVKSELSEQIEDLARITKEALDKKMDLEYA